MKSNNDLALNGCSDPGRTETRNSLSSAAIRKLIGINIADLKRLLAATSFAVCAALLTSAVHAQTPVTVTNPTAQPIPVKDQFNGALQPVTFYADLTLYTQNMSPKPVYTVPDGKRLVIESCSAFAMSNSHGSFPVYFRIRTSAANQYGSTYLPAGPMMSSGSHTFQAASTSLRAYADANTSVAVGIGTVEGQWDTPLSGAVSCYGYLVDLPKFIATIY